MLKTVIASMLVLTASSCAYRHMRVAQDVTPGNPSCEKFDARYGATDIRVQTTKVLGSLMNRWYNRTGWQCQNGRPRIVITDIDNRTDCYISADMIRDIFEGVAVDDGRFIIVVGDKYDEAELDQSLEKYSTGAKYNPQTKPGFGVATAPQFLAKVRITKAKTAQPRYDLEDYRMTVTLYDIETQEVVDSSWDVLSKQVWR